MLRLYQERGIAKIPFCLITTPQPADAFFHNVPPFF